MKRAISVEQYIEENSQWSEELGLLRSILTSTELKEDVKWGAPIYTINGKNVVGMGSFKSYVGLWFHQGVFLKDPAGKLINANEGVTRGLRQWRFQSKEEMDPALIRAYVEEAIRNQKAGKEIKPEKKQLEIPPEMENAMKKDAKLRQRFEAFTPGRQREFAEYVASAKREETRISRMEKIAPMIMEGMGLNDKYR